MYDIVKFEEQPEGLPEVDEWQTKDFDCTFDTYVVRKDNHLFRANWERVDFHGIVYIIGSPISMNERFVRYELKFTNGVFISHLLIKGEDVDEK